MARSKVTEPEFPERFNLADYYLDARVREGHGDRTALLHRDRSFSYQQCQAMANRMSHVLAGLGVRDEDRVLIALPDCPEFMAALFATWKLGAVVTMVNPWLPPEDYAYYLGYTRARALVCDESLRDALKDTVTSSRHLQGVLCRGADLDARLGAASPEHESADTHRDDIAMWLFTSGSTGKPKAAVHMHHDFAFNTERYARRVLGMNASDVTLSVPKLFFGYATGTNLMFPFAVGGAAVLFEEKATPEIMFELIEKHRPTVVTNVPTMIGKMLAADETGSRDLSCIRACLSAGEALPEDLQRRWVDRYGCEILDGIGSAEMFHIYITNYPGDVKPGSLGKLVPGYEARLVDDDGNDVPTGDIGTLWVKGDSAALCYFQAHEKSKEVLRGDWVVSGDKFRQDADGYFYYVGRGDDLLKVGGIFVAPNEVENVLMTHPAVHECVVVGYEDGDGLTKPRAVVVVHPGHFATSDALADELIEWSRQRLAHYKAPRRIEFRDALPRNDRGKISRRDV